MYILFKFDSILEIMSSDSNARDLNETNIVVLATSHPMPAVLCEEIQSVTNTEPLGM